MDGWITIGTKLDTSKFDGQISDLKNKISQEEEKQKINIEVKSQLEEEYSKITSEVRELTQAYNQAANQAERLKNIAKNTKVGSYENYMATQEYDKQIAKIDEINSKLEDANTKQAKISEKISKNNLQYQSSVDRVSALKNKIDQIGLKKQEQDAKAMKVQLKEAEKNVSNMQKGIQGAIGKIGKMTLAIFGIRSALNAIRQASSTLAQYNKQYATDLEYMKFAIAQGIAPVLEKVVQLAQTLLAYVNYLTQRLFGVNIFANATADAFKKAKDSMGKMSKSSKELKNNLAAFDELNVLDKNQQDTTAPSVDIGGLTDVEIPEWLEKLGDMLQPLRDFATQSGGLFEKITNGFSSMFSKLTSAAESFWKFIKPFVDTFTNYILPVVTSLASQITKTVGTLFNTISRLLNTLWNSGIKPAAELIMHIWDGLWQGVSNAWAKWGEPIFNNLRTAIEWIGTIMDTLWNTILLPIWQHLIEVLTKLWDEHLKPLWDNLLDFFGELINGALEIWNNALAPLINWLIEKLSPIVVGVVNTIINIVGQALGTITDVINAIITILKGIVEFIVGVFTGDWDKAWQGVKDIFQGIWDGITAIVKGAINLVIEFINGMISGIEKSLNWIVDKINSLEIVNPFDGETIWSPNVPKFAFGRIPKLAKGGIVNTPTRAIVGEAGREAVLPLDSNTEWMDMLAERLNGRGGTNNITIRFTGSAAQLVRMLKPELEKEEKRTGQRLITGGAY